SLAATAPCCLHFSLPRIPCYHSNRPPRQRRAASASASTPRATATTPPSSTKRCNRPLPSCSSPSPLPVMPCCGNASNASPSGLPRPTSSSASTPPARPPPTCST